MKDLKLVIGLSLKKFEIPILKNSLKKHPALNNYDVTWLHMYENKSSIIDMPDYLQLNDKQMSEVKNKVTGDIENLVNSIGNFKKQKFKIIFCEDRKQDFIKYCIEEKIDLVITTCKKRSGIEILFGSSFAEYCLENLPIDQLVLK